MAHGPGERGCIASRPFVLRRVLPLSRHTLDDDVFGGKADVTYCAANAALPPDVPTCNFCYLGGRTTALLCSSTIFFHPKSCTRHSKIFRSSTHFSSGSIHSIVQRPSPDDRIVICPRLPIFPTTCAFVVRTEKTQDNIVAIKMLRGTNLVATWG
jgi:hypothetical protein